jgi:tripartite-type tricarboxylate transporter receptor subunit TctC
MTPSLYIRVLRVRRGAFNAHPASSCLTLPLNAYSRRTKMNTHQDLSRFLLFFVGAIVFAANVNTYAEDTPGSQGIEFIVPFGPGGGADQLARKTGKLLEAVLGSPATLTNIPGATGNTGIKKLLTAPADGHSVAVLTADTYALLAYLNPGWKPTDVIPLAVMVKQPSAFFVSDNSSFKNWHEFEKEARLRPNTLRVAISGLGSPDYVMLQQFAAKGVKLVPVPFANPTERYLAIFRGQADALYEQPGDVKEFIENKQMLPVLFFGAERDAAFRNIPSSRELGFGTGLPQFRAIVVRDGTEPERIKALSDALGKIAATPEYKTFLKEQMASDDSYMAGKDAVDFMQGQLKMMKEAIDALPYEARFIIQAKEFEEYVEPF